MAGNAPPSQMPPLVPFSARLRDGTVVHVRCLQPTDREYIRRGLALFSPASTYQRFHTPLIQVTEPLLTYLTDVDQVDHVAVGALDPAADMPGVAVARYIRMKETPEVAELAVSVLDAYQDRGVGTLLLAALSVPAEASGIRFFRAYILSERRRLIERLLDLGALVRAQRAGVSTLDLPVPLPAPPTPAGRHYRDVLRTVRAGQTLSRSCDPPETDESRSGPLQP